MKLRYIQSGDSPAVMNMAMDEAILEAVSAGDSPPTLRLYGWEPHAVSIGYFQSIFLEVDIDECGRLGVDIVRRLTGGGAVYHDAELTYSLIMPKDMLPEDILSSYKLICNGIVEGMSTLGIVSEFAPLNDIISGGKKISGNAQTRRMGCVLQHGTVLLDVDVDKMFSVLRVPDEKSKGKLIENVKQRVTSISHKLGFQPPNEEVCKALSEGFASVLAAELEDGELTKTEMERSRVLSTERYGQSSWNDQR